MIYLFTNLLVAWLNVQLYNNFDGRLTATDSGATLQDMFRPIILIWKLTTVTAIAGKMLEHLLLKKYWP